MADVIEETPEEENPEDFYIHLATEEPERELEVTEELTHKKTIDEAELENRHLSDLQTVIKFRFPDFGNIVDNALMMSRESPDVFKALFRLKTNADIRKSNPNKPVNVVDIALKNYTILTIPLDGKGGIDLIELAGVANDKEIAQLSKNLGLAT